MIIGDRIIASYPVGQEAGAARSALGDRVGRQGDWVVGAVVRSKHPDVLLVLARVRPLAAREKRKQIVIRLAFVATLEWA